MQTGGVDAMLTRITKLLTFVLALTTCVVAAQANLLPGVTATTDMGTFYTYDIADLTNGSGLSELSFAGSHSNLYYEMWMADAGNTTGSVWFDLGQLESVIAIGIWNYNFLDSGGCCFDRGVHYLDIYTSTDDVAYTFLTNVELPIADGSPVFAVVVDAGGVMAQYVRFDILSNWGNSLYTGLSEVQFDVDVPTPAETTSWSSIKTLYR